MFNSFASILLLGYVTVPLPPGTYTEPVKPGVNQATEVAYRGSGRINPPNAELSTDQQCSREGNAGHPTCRYF